MTEAVQRQRKLLICLCLAVTTAAVYAPVRHFQFINYDDNEYVTGNAHVRGGLTAQDLRWAFVSSRAGNWHPLTWISHMADCQVFGLNPGAHHLVNVLFHIANSVLLFLVLSRMTTAPWRSAFVAGLFALHPLHVESVAWVAERKDVLSAFFWMLTIGAYVRYVGRDAVPRVQGWPRRSAALPCSVWYIATLCLFALALMAKPMVVTLPFVLLILDYWPLGRTRWAQSEAKGNTVVPPSRLLKEKAPFFVLAAVLSAVTVWAQRSGGAISSLERLPVGERIANALVSYVRYLGKMFWPTDLAVFYPRQQWPWGAVVGAGAILAGVTAWTIWRAIGAATRRREPYFLAGWLWYLGTLVPVIGLVQVGLQSMADRYAYLPSIGVFIMVAWAAPRAAVERPAMKAAAAVAAVALLAACATVSWSQIHYWKNSETLFRHALKVTRNNYVAHNNLGYDLADRGKLAEAIIEYKAALQIRPDQAELRNNLGVAYARLGRIEEALAEYAEALRIDPNCVEAHNSLGLALAAQGKTAEAIEQYQAALRINPDLAEAHNNLATALAAEGKIEEAAAEYAEAFRVNPGSAEAHYNLANLLASHGRMAEAMAEYETALRINPDYAEAHNNLGNLLSSLGRLPEAIAEYKASLRVNPDNPEAHCNLGVALANQGAFAEAIPEYEAALRIKPDLAEAHYNLGNALAAQGRLPEAVAEYQATLRLRPDWPLPMRKLAWLLATVDAAKGGDPQEAIGLAERASALVGNQGGTAYLDTLAAAYAAAGRFNDAIATAHKAVALARSAGQTQVANEIEARVQSYREGRPYRAPVH
jgi:tetratricopeptide (TPR) repeat protein